MNVLQNLLRDGSREWRSCDATLQTMKDLVRRKNLLNQRQCEDLTRRLTMISENIHLIVQQYNFHWHPLYGRDRPSTSDYYRCLEKAKMLVTNCGEKEWYRAAALQWRNVNAFEEILLDASLCYNVIYERGKLILKESALPEDLRHSSVFEPASDNSAVREDEEDLIKRLQKLIEDPATIKSEHLSCPEEVARALALATFLTTRFAADRSVVNDKQKDTSIGIMWDDHMDFPGAWGEACDLKGTGSELVKAISTEWLGIPCFRKEFLADEDENAFLKEASIIAHRKHPNIIRYLFHGNSQNPKCRFIGMELMEMSLSKLIEEQRGEHFSMEVTIDIIIQIGRGMCYLHDQQVAHRDLKPQNVVIKKWRSTPDFEGYCDVKLVDFGISKTEVDDTKSNTMTYLGIGTPKYWAPELQPSSKYYSKNKVNWLKADVYSFAMTCVHVLSLKPPFSDAEVKMTSYDLYRDILNGTSRPRLPRNCPQMLRKLLEDCWHILPCERPDFVQICSRLAQGWETSDGAIDFIHKKIVSQSHRCKRISKVKATEVKATKEDARIISCTFNHKLVLLDKRPSDYNGKWTCDICYPSRIGGGGGVYNCSTCKFDAHRDCAEIREEICVFFHGHPLQLLVQNFYKDDPKAICSLCEGSIQNSEWVYRCEQCEYDVHTLCTKFPNNKRVTNHEHPLTMRSCPPQMSLLCGRCNGEIQERAWHYYCRPCAFSMHLTCISRPIDPLCSFDNSPSNSHRYVLKIVPRIFHCTLCDEEGYSQFYHCKHCDVDMHPDCVDYMNEEACNWNRVYEKLLMEKESKDVQAQTILISEILEKMSSFCDSEPKLSTHKPPSVVKKVKTPIHNPTTLNESHESLDLANDLEVQRKMICARTAERIKAKKLALIRLRENPVEILENLEKIVSNLQSFESASEDEKNNLIVVHKRLKEHQQLVKELKATQEESKLCPGPRIGVFFKNVKKDGKFWGRQLLIDLQAGMKDVCFDLLCEKPGHEHIVQGKTRKFEFELYEEHAENLKPLLACGLHIVKNNITSSKDDLANLESISIPDLGAKFIWDLSAINKIKGMEDIGVLKQGAVSSSQWFLKSMEVGGNIKENYGLHRIRYTVTQEGNPPCYKNGSIAWLCKEHFDDGLKVGILESYSSKYHNIEDDYEIRYPPYLRQL